MPSPVNSGIIFVQEIDQRIQMGTTNVLSFAAPNQAGNLIVVYHVLDNAGPISVNDSQGNVYRTCGIQQTWNGGSARIDYASNAKAGPNTVMASYQTAATNYGLLYLQEYSGLDPVNPCDASAQGSGTGTQATSGSVSLPGAGELIFGGFASAANILSPGPGFQTRSVDFGNLTEDLVSQAAGSYEVSAVNDGTDWVALLAAFRPAGAGPSPAPSPTPTSQPDTTPPSVAITSPSTGSTVAVGNIVPITATASDNLGVAHVDFYVNGGLRCSKTAAPYRCAWTVPWRTGRTYHLQAKAYDAGGNAATSMTVTVTSH
jgi:hypothetical protein